VQTVTAAYNTQYQLTVTTNLGSTSPTLGTWYNAGSAVTIYAVSPSAAAGEQYAWNGWTGSGTGSYSGTGNNSALVTMNSPITEAASWTLQYQVTFVCSPSGTGSVNQVNGYFNAGPLSVTATPASGYVFDHWSSDTSSISFDTTTANSATAIIDGPVVVTAAFAEIPPTPTPTPTPSPSPSPSASPSPSPTTPTIQETTLTISATPHTVNNTGTDHATITGTLSSQGTGLATKTVTLSYSDGSAWVEIGTTITLSDGTYQYTWIIPSAIANGHYVIKADFAGDTDYAPSSSVDNSGLINLFVVPEYLWGGLAALGACFAALFIFSYHRRHLAKTPQII
jgi:hypothetical protein